MANEQTIASHRRGALMVLLANLDSLEVAAHEIRRQVAAGELIQISASLTLAGVADRALAGLVPFTARGKR